LIAGALPAINPGSLRLCEVLATDVPVVLALAEVRAEAGIDF